MLLHAISTMQPAFLKCSIWTQEMWFSIWFEDKTVMLVNNINYQVCFQKEEIQFLEMILKCK